VNGVDYIIIGVLGLSVLTGLWRGLISEVLALATWLAAFWVAWMFGPTVAAHFEHTIEMPMARLLVGYGLCFIAVLILGALVRYVIHRLVESTGLGGTDRLLGMVFGFARGVLLVTLMVFLLGLTAFSHESLWRDSVLLPQFQGAATWLGQQLPASVRDHLHPDHLPALPKMIPGMPPAHSTSSPAPASPITAVMDATSTATITATTYGNR